jgi:hypothetical protein
MCLELTLHLRAKTRTDADTLERACSTRDCLAVWVRKPGLFTRSETVTALVGEDGTCACSLLADDAEWDAPTWQMLPEVLPKLAMTLACVAEHAPEGFTLDVLWAGERVKEEVSVSPDELCALARSGQLAQRTRYRVQRVGSAVQQVAAVDKGLQ